MRRVLPVVALLAGGQAVAQDLRYSPQATRACLDATGPQGDRRACIGRSADACTQATSDGSTTVGLGYCLDREREDWDKRLNQVYQYILGKAAAADAEMQQIGSSAPATAPALRRAQRAWIDWRDATCDFEMAQWGGGTGGGPALVGCLMRLTGEQALYLEQAWIGE